jgi:hypothetical protein
VSVERIRETNTYRGRGNLIEVSILECIVYQKPKFIEFLSAMYVELIVKSARVDGVSKVLSFGIWNSLFMEKSINSAVRKALYVLFLSALLLFFRAVYP